MKCRLRRAFLPALALLAVLAPLTAAAAPPLVIRNARVFDGVRVIGVASVLVENGRITSIAGKTAVPAGATIVDAAGMTLLPGLIDSHAHAFGGALEQAPVFGVTTILDMFTTVGFAAERRAEQRAGKADARADLFSAGTLVTAPKGHGTEYGVPIPTLASPQGAAEFVDGRLAEGSDYIKIVYDDGAAFGLHSVTLSRETLAAVIAATHARRKLAVVHIGSLEGAREAVEAGANGLAHLFGDRAADEAFVKLAMKRRTFVIPTLSVIESVTGVASGAGLVRDTSMAPLLTAEDVANLKRAFPKRSESPTSLARASETLRKLAAAGVHILAGTDAPNPGTAHGVSLHRELELLVAAGLSPVQALAAATSVPAESFGLQDRGRIAPGRRADLLLVKGDPTTDITGMSRSLLKSVRSGGMVRLSYDRVESQRRTL